MTQPAEAGEPSMEEILASIRRIIAEDEAAGMAQPEPGVSGTAPAMPTPEAASRPTAPPATAGAQQERQAADIPQSAIPESAFAATASASRPAPVGQLRSSEGAGEAGVADVAQQSAAKPDAAQLLSREASAAVDSAFNTLAQAVLVRNARTLEDLVHDMLRPMLKSWLDAHLPGLVERLVRAEIERVSRAR